MTCTHHWVLTDPNSHLVSGVCKHCGAAREFLGSWDEMEQQGKRYGRNYATLRGAAKQSAEKRALIA